ncbi:uncharacterized protein METZ01_LOCUS349228, partial [marine metagenome]
MKQTLTRIIISLTFFIGLGITQDMENQSLSIPQAYENGNGEPSNQNRLPQLLRDVKVLLSEAFIADVMLDTLEVVYSLNRIFDFLSEADQYG